MFRVPVVEPARQFSSPIIVAFEFAVAAFNVHMPSDPMQDSVGGIVLISRINRFEGKIGEMVTDLARNIMG